jgi:hypothetical protein
MFLGSLTLLYNLSFTKVSSSAFPLLIHLLGKQHAGSGQSGSGLSALFSPASLSSKKLRSLAFAASHVFATQTCCPRGTRGPRNGRRISGKRPSRNRRTKCPPEISPHGLTMVSEKGSGISFIQQMYSELGLMLKFFGGSVG